MLKHFIKLSYNGSAYHGWQRQPNVPSVQETLETCFSKLLKTPIAIAGCGRTDTGVHASLYFAQGVFNRKMTSKDVFTLNKMLPFDIAIHEFYAVHHRAHVQHDALNRTYSYVMSDEKPALHQQTSIHCPFHDWNINKIKCCLRQLIGLRDYRVLCRTPDVYNTTLCHISEAKLIVSEDKTTLTITVTANRFLRNMMRLLISKLIQIAEGRLTQEQFFHHLNKQEAFPFFDPVPPQGLQLSGVEYPYILKPNK